MDDLFSIIRSQRGPFLEGPEKFSHPESRSKISNLNLWLQSCSFHIFWV